MLVLTRKKDEAVVIGDDIEIIISEISEDKVKIAIKAPKNVKIFRKELLAAVEDENLKSADMPDLDIDKLREAIKK
ncbi:MAG TPA: carbon storage regulator CsrA [Bacillota bacterium]|jgi:carbon storage regulator|nr:carbon storage regulator CsrA [Bacillota bacterium]HQE65593.1 carbon storage regulator CsrA [Bacillota bacterium]HQI16611.1 carbon storage regulator CsrA [Bacillota bacterium]HQL35226.1 carbon storage regulator CsrA [Bacillota bacterium]HRS20189.1 carbon storage regulator CsrA [Clostridia bacterium]